jgi:hypothetical protein
MLFGYSALTEQSLGGVAPGPFVRVMGETEQTLEKRANGTLILSDTEIERKAAVGGESMRL